MTNDEKLEKDVISILGRGHVIEQFGTAAYKCRVCGDTSLTAEFCRWRKAHDGPEYLMYKRARVGVWSFDSPWCRSR